MSEVKPKFAPAVQAVWNNCLTYVDSINPEVAASELEFFVNDLVETLIEAYRHADGSMALEEVLVEEGYVNE